MSRDSQELGYDKVFQEYGAFEKATSLTLPERIDQAYLIYAHCQQVLTKLPPSTDGTNKIGSIKEKLDKFLRKALNVDSIDEAEKIMEERKLKKHLNPEFIPGKQRPQVKTGLVDSMNTSASTSEVAEVNEKRSTHSTYQSTVQSRTKARYQWIVAAETALALSRGQIVNVDEENKQSDIADNIKMHDSKSRDTLRVIISRDEDKKDMVFQKMNPDGNTFSTYDTSQMTSHGKDGLAAITINMNGEISVFNHLYKEDRIAHSSMNASKALLFAGEIKITNGKLVAIYDHSGHYRPGTENIYQALKFFKQQGIDISNVTISCQREIYGLTEITDDTLPEHDKLYNAQELFEHMEKRFPVDAKQLSEIVSSVGADKINETDSMGKTLLAVAAESGHQNVVKQLLKKGADINHTTDEGESPLYRAAINEKLTTVVALLVNGADVNQSNNEQVTPLHAACFSGNADIVDALLKKGAKVNQADINGQTPLYYAASNGNYTLLQALLDQGADVNQSDNELVTPLHAACVIGNPDIVRILIEKGADMTMKDENQYAPLDYALEYGHVEIVEILLANDVANEKDIIRAIEKFSVYQYLTIGDTRKPTVNDLEKYSPIVRAMLDNNFDLVNKLVKDSPNNSVSNLEGIVAVHWAVRNNQVETLRELIAKNKNLNVNFPDSQNDTPLMKAVTKGNIEIVEEIISYEINNKSDISSNLTEALISAIQLKNIPMIDRLLTHMDVKGVNLKDSNDDTPLNYACQSAPIAIFEKLFEKGATIEEDDLSTAVLNNRWDIIRLTIEKSAVKVDIPKLLGEKDRYRVTALERVMKNPKDLKIILALMSTDEKASILNTKEQDSPLVLAVEQSPETFKIIWELYPQSDRRTAVEVKSKYGETLLELAIKNQNITPEVIKEMLGVYTDDQRLNVVRENLLFKAATINAVNNFTDYSERLQTIIQLLPESQRLEALMQKDVRGNILIVKIIKDNLYKDNIVENILSDLPVNQRVEAAKIILENMQAKPENVKDIFDKILAFFPNESDKRVLSTALQSRTAAQHTRVEWTKSTPTSTHKDESNTDAPGRKPDQSIT